MSETDKGFTGGDEAADIKKVAKKVKAKVAPSNPCGCGCGTPVRKVFAQGHDAKLKSRLLKLVYFGTEKEVADGRAQLEKWGWTSHISDDKIAKLAKAKAKKAEKATA